MMRQQPTFLAVFLLLTSTGIGRAMVDGRTNDPEWFSGVSNKFLIVEYESPSGHPWGKQLSQLIGRMALATMTGLDGFAVITLRQEDTRMKLSPANMDALGRRQRTPIVVWGEFYEDKGQIFLTSHLRYVPAAASTNTNPLRLSWNVSRFGVAGRTRAYASAPTVQVNFAPVQISRDNLVALQSLWTNTLVLREQPSDTAAQSGELTPDRPYYVLGASNGWTRLNVRSGGSGWVRLTEISQHGTFKDMAGIVLYTQGLLQYLAGNHRASSQTFTKYLAEYGARQDAMNRALAEVLIGYASYLDRSLPPAEQTRLALAHFQQAENLLPNSASPVNCRALALFKKAGVLSVTPQEVQHLEKSLIRAIQIENDTDAVRNLQILYQLPKAQDYFKTPANFVQARQQRLTVLQNLERQSPSP